MHNIQPPAHNIKVEKIGHAANAIKAISEAMINDRIFATDQVADYEPLSECTIGGLHYALEGLAAYIHLLSGAD